MIALWLAATMMGAAGNAPECTAQQLSDLLTDTTTPYTLTCSASLPPGRAVIRPVELLGPQSSHVRLDCSGGTLGSPQRPVTTQSPTLAIRSQRVDALEWQAPRSVQIQNCKIIGNVRIWGMGADGRYDDLRTSSRRADHTALAQAAAPSDITLSNVTITGMGSIPLYVGPGVTGVRLEGSVLDGRSTASAIYLDAESAGHVIRNNRLTTRTSREVISIDGSAHNQITDNEIDLHGRAGIYLYRNCGERGVIRHQTPSHNIINDNRFTGANWLRPRLVVENARNGRRPYCGQDAGYPYGSSIDNRDHASDNQITGNRRL